MLKAGVIIVPKWHKKRYEVITTIYANLIEVNSGGFEGFLLCIILDIEKFEKEGSFD